MVHVFQGLPIFWTSTTLPNVQQMAYRLPSKADTFERFRDKKSSKAKDYAIEIVTKMYCLDCTVLTAKNSGRKKESEIKAAGEAGKYSVLN